MAGYYKVEVSSSQLFHLTKCLSIFDVVGFIFADSLKSACICVVYVCEGQSLSTMWVLGRELRSLAWQQSL